MRTADTAALVSDKAVLLVLKQVSEAIILPRYKRLSDAEISTKTDANDFVTVADREAEADIFSKLLGMLPGSRCIGEESVAEGLCDITTSDANYTWIVDPIDGTRNFVAGEEHFCCMVSLIWEGTPLKSWIYRPLVGDAVVAGKDEGVSHYLPTGEVVACKPRWHQNELTLLQGTLNAMGFDLSIREQVRNKLRGLKGRFHLGSAGVDALYIALGQSDYLMHSKLTPWDSVPVELTCRELGYHVRLAPDETPFHWQAKGVLLAASTKKQWQEIADFIWSEIT